MSGDRPLPSQWIRTTLGELADYLNGRAFDKSEWSTRGRPIIRIQDLTGSGNAPNYYEGDVEDRYVIRHGDLLISWAATLGAYIWKGPEACLNQHIFKVIPRVDKRFLFYLVKSVIEDLYRRSHGSGMVHVTRPEFESTEVLLPPSAEQHRIVAAIEEQFTRLDAGVAALKRAQARLKRYRASILKAAVEGKLTEAWRAANPPSETASELLKRILAERRARWESDLKAKGKDPTKVLYEEPRGLETAGLPEVPAGWAWATVDQVTERSEYGTSVKCDYNANGVPVLRIPNIARGEVDRSDLKFSTEDLQISEENALRPGDVLVCRTNGSLSLIGKAAVVRDLYSPAHYFASYLLRFRLVEAPTLANWLYTFLGSPPGRAFLEQNAASSAGQHNVSLTLLHGMSFPLAPLNEQKQIVADVESRLSIVNVLEQTIEANLKRAERLRQSILAAAFAGRLVPQDPNDEPVSILLERIRMEREETPPSPSPTRGGRIGTSGHSGQLARGNGQPRSRPGRKISESKGGGPVGAANGRDRTGSARRGAPDGEVIPASSETPRKRLLEVGVFDADEVPSIEGTQLPLVWGAAPVATGDRRPNAQSVPSRAEEPSDV